MPQKSIRNKAEASQQNHLQPKELLQARMIYIYTAAFLLSALAMIIGAIWYHENQLAIAAFSALAFPAINIVAHLFGEKKITILLCEILFKKFFGK
jgi:hypothetical protein